MTDDAKTTTHPVLTLGDFHFLGWPWHASDTPAVRRLVKLGLMEKCCGDFFTTKAGHAAIDAAIARGEINNGQ